MEPPVTRKGEPLRNFTIALSKAQAETHAKRLAVLRHPTRQRLIKLLEQYPDQRLCVFEIADVLEVSYSVVSCHLIGVLCGFVGLVSAERYQMYLYYTLNTQALAIYREAARFV